MGQLRSGINSSADVASKVSSRPEALPYEAQLDLDPRWALSEGSRYFEENSAVHKTLRKITAKLDELKIPYAVVGGMALFAHGFRRFTEDIDILVSRPALKIIHKELDGLGYMPPFPRSKNLRDTEHGVKIEFLIAGEFPGDGKAKAVAFPDPALSHIEWQGIRVLNLAKLIELKIASGLTGHNREKDFVDVSQLIQVLDVPVGMAEQLNPYVREKFTELWHKATEQFVRVWEGAFPPGEISTLEELIQGLRQTGREMEARPLERMLSDGIALERKGGGGGGLILLVTTNRHAALKHGLHEEREFLKDFGAP